MSDHSYSSMDRPVSVIAPLQPIPPLPDPIPFAVEWELVQDVGHHEDAYFRAGWRCISRHEGHSLLCREGINGLQFVVMVETQ
jgi:hypothetical protein